MFRLTPDTNILVSATIIKGKEYKLLEAARLGKIKLLLSPEILKEFKDVISREKFGFSTKQIKDVFKELLDIIEIIIPSIKLNIIKEDLSDNRILECALQGRVNYIISGDEHLLRLRKFRNIRIIRAGEFLDILRSSEV